MGWFARETQIERLARLGGWPLLKTGEGRYGVRVGEGATLWNLFIEGQEGQPLVTFCAIYPVRFAWSSVTPDLSMELLRRNRNVRFGRWCLHVVDGEELALALHYTAASDGLSLAVFTAVCRELVAERSSVHEALCRKLPYLSWVGRDPAQATPAQRVKGRARPMAGDQVWLEE